MSQRAQIYAHLSQGHTLTPLEALELFNCLSLSQRAGELKRAGFPIRSEMIKLPNGKSVAQYSLERV